MELMMSTRFAHLAPKQLVPRLAGIRGSPVDQAVMPRREALALLQTCRLRNARNSANHAPATTFRVCPYRRHR